LLDRYQALALTYQRRAERLNEIIGNCRNHKTCTPDEQKEIVQPLPVVRWPREMISCRELQQIVLAHAKATNERWPTVGCNGREARGYFWRPVSGGSIIVSDAQAKPSQQIRDAKPHYFEPTGESPVCDARSVNHTAQTWRYVEPAAPSTWFNLPEVINARVEMLGDYVLTKDASNHPMVQSGVYDVQCAKMPNGGWPDPPPTIDWVTQVK
jgi:hypothetical protein